MQRLLVLGRGGAGKSTLARRLGELTGLSVIELDQQFWQTGQIPMPDDQWAALQVGLVAAERWILDGDLGRYDVLEARLPHADTILVLDFSVARCVWRSLRRGRQHRDYWAWVFAYRRSSLLAIKAMIERHAPDAELRVFRNPRELNEYVNTVTPDADQGPSESGPNS